MNLLAQEEIRRLLGPPSLLFSGYRGWSGWGVKLYFHFAICLHGVVEVVRTMNSVCAYCLTHVLVGILLNTYGREVYVTRS
jgi:hypothetical protein